MHKNTEQKIAVITGSSRGLGLVLAAEFAKHGWRVAGTGRSEQPVEFPEGAVYHQFDAGSASECESFWRQLKTDFPEARICLVNNAGGYVRGGLLETKPEAYEQQMSSIYFSAVYMTRGLVAAWSHARILNVISSSALMAHKNNSAYGAAKAAETHFFQAIVQEFEASQYQVTNFYPKSIASHGSDSAAIDPKDLATLVREQAENERTYYVRDITVYPR